MSHSATMQLTRRNHILYIRKRVPRRYKPVETREFLWLSLHTDSEEEAKQKAPAVWRDMLEAWETKLEGSTAEGEERIKAAKNLAARRGYRYLPATEVAKLPLEELLRRIEGIMNSRGHIDIQEAEALLGVADLPELTVTDAMERYWKVAKAKTLGKSDDQIRRWKNPRIKAVENFVKVVGDMPIADILTANLFDFRDWWIDRIARGEVSANSANKDMIHLVAMIREVARATDTTLRFSTDKLMLDEGKKNQRPAFSTEWITDKLLVPGALAGLNAEARCILLGMVNTGYRPSEGAMLTSSQIRLDGAIPYIQIEAVGRTLKSHHAERKIPLTGISLAAFREFPAGFPRYADNAGLSDTINKFLRENKLLETDAHTLYGLRHSFEDRMLAAGVDERIRRDLMGHSLDRERYGKGASLEQLHRLLSDIAL